MGFLANLLVRIGVDPSDLNTGMDRATRTVNKFGQDVTTAGRSLTVGMSLPLIGLATAAVKSAADLESLSKGLTSITGSSGETAKQLERLKEVARLPGLGFQEAVRGSINLQAAGFSAQLAEKSLKAFGNALATVGKGKNELDGVILALTQIQAKGKVSAEEINQLQERLPQIRKAMKDAFGTADTETLKKMGIDSQQFIEKIVAEFQKLPPVTSGLNNSFENLKDSAFQALAGIGNILKPFVQNFIDNWLQPMIEKTKVLAEEFGKLPKPLQNTVLGVGAAAAVFPLLTVAIGAMITNTITIAVALGNLTKVIVATSVALGTQLAAALGLTTAGMTALSVAGAAAAATLTLLLIPAVWELIKARNAYKDAEQGAAEATELQKAKLKQLEDSLRKNGAAIDEMSGRYKSGQITLTAYLQYLRDVAVGLGKSAQAHQQHGETMMSVEKALQTLSIKSTAERRKDLADAQAAYAALKASGKENSIVLQEAANKVKAAYEALNGALKETKEKFAAIPFGQKGLEAAILVEQIKQLRSEQEKFIQDVAKAGGIQKYHAEQLTKVGEAMKLLENPPAIEGFGKLSGALHDALNPAQALPPELQKIANALEAFGLAGKRADIEGLQSQFDVLGEGLESGAVSVDTYLRAWIQLVKAMDAAGVALDKSTIAEVIELEKQYGGQIKEVRKEQNQFQREVEKTFASVSRGIAKNIVDLKGFGQTGLNVAKELATGFLEIMLKQLFKPLEAQFAKLAGALGKVLHIGGGAAASAAGSAASAGAGAAGSAASGAGGAAGGAGSAVSGAASGLMGTIGAVSAAVGAVSSVIGNFQMAGMNKSLDVLVNHTLRIFNVVAQGLDEHYLAKGQLFLKLDDMWNEIRNVVAAVKSGGVSGKGMVSFNNCTFNATTPEAMMKAAFQQASLAGAM